MPRPPTISYDDFRAAALGLMETGEVPTFSRLRLKLGGGSYDVLRRYLDAFEQEKATRLRVPAMPDDVLGGIQGWYERIREEASAQARSELNAEFETLAQQRTALEGEFARLRDEARDAKRDLERGEAEARELREELAQSRADGARLAGEIAAAHGELAVERERHRHQTAITEELRLRLAQAAHDAVAGIALADERARSLERTLLQRHDEAVGLWKVRLRELEAEMRTERGAHARQLAQSGADHAAERALHEKALGSLAERQAVAEQDVKRRDRELAALQAARQELEVELAQARTTLAGCRSQAALLEALHGEVERLVQAHLELTRGKSDRNPAGGSERQTAPTDAGILARPLAATKR